MKFEISPFASNEEKLLEINETLESIKDVLAELVFDMEDDGRDVSTLDDALAALDDAIDGINDAVDEIEDEELELDEEAEDEETTDTYLHKLFKKYGGKKLDDVLKKATDEEKDHFSKLFNSWYPVSF